MMNGEFSGNVYEGHLRTPDASGSRVNFEGENMAAYDFSDNLRHFQWGITSRWRMESLQAPECTCRFDLGPE